MIENTDGSEDRGTANPITVLVAATLLVSSTAVIGAGMVGQMNERADQQATVEEAVVDVTHSDRLEITPLIGESISLADTKVRVTFPNSDNQGFVVTDVGAAVEESYEKQKTETKQVKIGEKEVPIYESVEEPIYEERTSVVRDGTRTVEQKVPRYRWTKTDTEQIPKYEWKKSVTKTEKTVSDERPGSGWSRDTLVRTETELVGYSYEKVQTGYTYERVFDGYTYERVFDGYEKDCSYSWYSGYTCDRTATYTYERTATYTFERQPTYSWQKTPEYEPVHHFKWTRQYTETKTTVSTDDPGSQWSKASSTPVGYETNTVTTTELSHQSPGSEWNRGTQLGTTTIEREVPNYDTVTKEVKAGTKTKEVVSHYETQPKYETVERQRTEFEFDDDNRLGTAKVNGEPFDDEPKNQGIATAMEAIPLVESDDSDDDRVRASEVVAGVGGEVTNGGSTSSMWSNGESFVVQLESAVIDEDHLVRVQVIDTESQQVVIDQKTRATNLQAFEFGSETVTEDIPVDPVDKSVDDDESDGGYINVRSGNSGSSSDTDSPDHSYESELGGQPVDSGDSGSTDEYTGDGPTDGPGEIDRTSYDYGSTDKRGGDDDWQFTCDELGGSARDRCDTKTHYDSSENDDNSGMHNTRGDWNSGDSTTDAGTGWDAAKDAVSDTVDDTVDSVTNMLFGSSDDNSSSSGSSSTSSSSDLSSSSSSLGNGPSDRQSTSLGMV